MKNFELRIKNSPITHPPSGTQNKRLLSNRGPQSKPRLVCLLWGEGKRRNMSPNDAKHQSLRPCYRTREQSDIVHAISSPNATPITNYQLPITYHQLNCSVSSVPLPLNASAAAIQSRQCFFYTFHCFNDDTFACCIG